MTKLLPEGLMTAILKSWESILVEVSRAVRRESWPLDCGICCQSDRN